MANKLPKNWITENCTEVVQFLNKNFRNSKYAGLDTYYGVRDGISFSTSCDTAKYKKVCTFLSTSEFKELSKEEVFERGELVEVRGNEGIWVERFYIATLSKETNCPFACVTQRTERDFLSFRSFELALWQEMRKKTPKKTQKEIEVEQAIELLKKEGKIVDGKILSI